MATKKEAAKVDHRRKRPESELSGDAKRFRAMLGDLGLSQSGAARFLDVQSRTVRMWASGELPLPPMVDMLLTYMAKTGLTPEAFLKVCGIKRSLTPE